MQTEVAIIGAVLVIVALGGMVGVAYETQKKVECKKAAIEQKYDYKEIELICK